VTEERGEDLSLLGMRRCVVCWVVPDVSEDRVLIFASPEDQEEFRTHFLYRLPFDDEDKTARESYYLERVYIGPGGRANMLSKQSGLLVIRE